MKVSVVVPALNEEKYIRKCLASLCDQTVQRGSYEILVVDDQSEDGTAGIAKRFADKVITIPRAPVGAVRDSGLKAAGSDIVAFTDADTTVPRDWVERIAHGFDDPSVVAVYGNLGFDLKRHNKKLIDGFHHSTLKALNSLGVMHPVGANFAVRKLAALEAGGFRRDMRMMEEFDLIQRIRKMGRIEYDPDLVVTTSARRIRKPLASLSYATCWVDYLLKGTTKDVEFEAVR